MRERRGGRRGPGRPRNWVSPTHLPTNRNSQDQEHSDLGQARAHPATHTPPNPTQPQTADMKSRLWLWQIPEGHIPHMHAVPMPFFGFHTLQPTR